ncbi:exported hypothetical protein [uncultured Pleomorphomonas sp.]|uniref:EF-hand domain-containing protein n=2 Tax=Pleomorphomonas TaxID=261933 RepID=A0A2G9WZQ4_9HYPH|nr:hypothetical protein [Pleomorphomonas carboxyditropha]PIO99802.1 hypothetical protein CJ014_07785 [Pleomorphomonas carboxyditropha]SCM77256.1 exported hypothetical protein [uncultured Pleomorphomonas sp.]
MKALTLATISALSVITVGTVAFAAGPGMGPMGFGPAGGPMKFFADADTNKDGKLDAAEIAAYRDKMFAEANSDGQDGVTIQEFEPWFWKQHREMMVRAFQRLDADGDGQISKAEADAASDRLLSRFDRNNDGVLSSDDRPRRDGWGRDGKHGRHHGPGMMQHRMGQNDGPDQGGPADEAPADEAPAPAPAP